MRRVELDHWFIDRNELNISLMNFHVGISPLIIEDHVYYKVRIVDSNRKDSIYIFENLEKSVEFTEEIVNKVFSLEEVGELYKDSFSKNKKLIKR